MGTKWVIKSYGLRGGAAHNPIQSVFPSSEGAYDVMGVLSSSGVLSLSGGVGMPLLYLYAGEGVGLVIAEDEYLSVAEEFARGDSVIGRGIVDSSERYELRCEG